MRGCFFTPLAWKRRKLVHPTLFILSCLALLALVICSHVSAYKFGKYQGWTALLRKHATYQKKHIAINEGETLVAVLEIKKGSYIFLRNDVEEKKRYE
jgi:hypothetical protein